jgi:hypothetical protein
VAVGLGGAFHGSGGRGYAGRIRVTAYPPRVLGLVVLNLLLALKQDWHWGRFRSSPIGSPSGPRVSL